MTPRTVAIVVIGAIVFGLTARLFAWSVRTVKNLYARFITNYLVRALVGALVVLAAYALLDAWEYAGLSTWLSGAGLAGTTTLADAAIKLVVTALTLGAGFQGGEVTPLFGIGAALGGWIGCLAGLDPSFMAALGMLGVFCAGLNVPITTCMMAIDLFHGTAAASLSSSRLLAISSAATVACTPRSASCRPSAARLSWTRAERWQRLSSATTT